jgi:hypothetical protein
VAKIAEHMRYNYLNELRNKNAAWRLLAASQAGFIAAFFYQEFIAANQRAIREEQVINHLSDFLYDANRGLPEDQRLVRPPREYLATWSDPQHAWLRRFYIEDEVHYDLTSAAQRAVDWLYGLKKSVFDLLHELARDTDDDPEKRLRLLKEQREKLNKQILAVEAGQVEVLDEVQVKERFLHAISTAQGILADFREVEENFRQLERNMLDKIVTWKQGKGELLEQIFLQQDSIVDSEQGRSFAAFWRFLMFSQQQEDFRATLQSVLKLADVQDIKQELDFLKIYRQWFAGASEVQTTIASLSKQLRRYVDENYLEEERRIFSLIQKIEGRAINLRESQPKMAAFMEIDALKPAVELPFDRPLFVPPQKSQLKNTVLEAGKENVPVEALFSQVYVDKAVLQENIDRLLQQKSPVTLGEVIAAYPLKQGLTELMAYMVIASRENQECFDEKDWEEVLLSASDGQRLAAKINTICFCRKNEVNEHGRPE